MIRSSHDTPDPSWTAGCSGEISSLVNRLQGRRRTLLAMRVGGALTLLMAVGLGGWLAGQAVNPGADFRARLTCREVHDNAADYVAKGPNCSLASAIVEHLTHCRRCREYIASLRPAMAVPPVNAVLPPANADAHIPPARSGSEDFVLAVHARRR
jgi:hypothetical protein